MNDESPSTLRVSIVIPCYLDEAQVEVLLAELGPVIDGFEGGGELILVDDGSPDGTGARALELAPTFGRPITVVRLARNFGQHPAVFAGLAAARGQVVVVADSDLQYPAHEIAGLVDLVDDEHQVVSGYRSDRKDPITRRWISGSLSHWLGGRTGQKLIDYGSMFRAYDREVVDAMLGVTEHHRYVPAIPSWLGYHVLEVPVEHRSRGAQGSRYRFSSLVALFLDLLTSYSISPMRVVSFSAVIGAMLGFFATFMFVVYRIAVGDGISGTVSAFALIFALLAVQLMVLALLGEYVGRIYVEIRHRPYYVVRTTSRFGASEPAASDDDAAVSADRLQPS